MNLDTKKQNTDQGLTLMPVKISQQSVVGEQAGFSLVELMVGLVIGLFATLAIMQVFGVFEGQKRTTSGTSDAQTNGSVALYDIQRDVRLAGFGLPLFDRDNMPLNCAVMPTVNHDQKNPTPLISLFPIQIIDGGTAAGASDTVIVRYGNSATGGVGMEVVDRNGADVKVNNSDGCATDDVVISINGTACTATTVNAVPATGIQVNVRNPFTGINVGDTFACLGSWNEYRFQINGADQLTRLDTFDNTVPTPIVDGIVNLQAQYGIAAAPDSNQIIQWVNATGVWAAPGIASTACSSASANRNCIKAVRVAIVARNGLLEKNIVTPAALIAWDAASANPTIASPAPTVDLSNTPNWNQYRYKVYESIIPLRNIIWTRGRL